jgi:hypothetical protein
MSAPELIATANAVVSLHTWPISAPKVLPGIEVLHATYKN